MPPPCPPVTPVLLHPIFIRVSCPLALPSSPSLSPDLQGSLFPASPQRLCESRGSVRTHTPEDGVSARNQALPLNA